MMRLRYTILLLATLGFAGCDDTTSGIGSETVAGTEQPTDAEHHRKAGFGSNDIQPGSTETFQLLFRVPKWATRIVGVALAHRSSPTCDFSHVFVTR